MPSGILRLKTLGVALLTALLMLALGGQPAYADEHDFPDGYPRTASSNENEPGYLVKFASGNMRPILFKVLTGPGREPLRAYCIESKVSYQQNHGLKMVGWDAFPGDNRFATDATVRAKVAWIARRSYPQTSLAELSEASGIAGLTDREAITATQAALWHLTDGLEYQGVAESVGADVSHRVDTLFAYLTGSANTGLTTGGGPTVGIDAPDAAGVAGQPVGPIRIDSSEAAAKVEVDVDYPLVDGQGNAVDLNAVPTNTDLFLNVPTDAAPGKASITASVVGSRFAGNLLISREGRTQTIVVVGSEEVTADADGEVSWIAAPRLTPSPSPTPSASTPAPAPTPSDSDPTPSKAAKPGLPKTGN